MISLKKKLDIMGLSCYEEQIIMFEKYMEGILSWNEKVNLTAIIDRSEFIDKHFVDSLVAAEREELKNATSIIDVGTGAGFPGIPLAIIFPEKKFTLMDSLGKRLKIIEELCNDIGIRNVNLIHARAEDLANNKNHRETYDICVSRAVANLSTLSEYCLPFVKKGGYFLAYKGRDAEEEVAAAKNAIRILGGNLQDVYLSKLISSDYDHKILFIKKENNTPSKYPRKAGTPSKEPLK